MESKLELELELELGEFQNLEEEKNGFFSLFFNYADLNERKNKNEEKNKNKNKNKRTLDYIYQTIACRRTELEKSTGLKKK